jgi:predicted O-methyltransferase YrrM
MNEYQFSSDWVTHRTDIWKQVLLKLENKNQFLEIGSYEGRSAVWFIDNALAKNGKLTCIDLDYQDLFDKNLDICLKNNTDKKLIKLTGYSYFHLSSLITQKKEFDLIYIDGSHKAKDVITDACLSWYLLKLNGILIFDDYLLQNNDVNAKIAIDLFVDMFKANIKYLYIGDQFIIQKIRTKF